MNRHAQLLMSDYLSNPFASGFIIARSMLRLHGKRINQNTLKSINSILYNGLRDNMPREDMVESVSNQIAAAEPRRRMQWQSTK